MVVCSRSVVTFVSGAFLVVLLGSSKAYALTINDPGVVGAVDGKAGDNAGKDALWLAQGILDLGMGVTISEIPGGRTWRASSLQDYEGDLIGPGVKYEKTLSVPAGYDFALAKYKGQNGGWVLFYLGGKATDLPQYSFSIWGSNSGQYEISNFTGFESVPDGGSAAALLGAALVGLGLLRRLGPPKPSA